MQRSQFSDQAPGHVVRLELHHSQETAGRFERVPIARQAFVPHPLPPKLDWQAMKASLFDEYAGVLLALGKLNGLHKTLDRAAPLLRTLWMREAKLSSAVEDIQTTFENMVLAGAGRANDRFGEGKKGEHFRRSALEAWNYVQALELGLSSPLPMSTRLIRDMHRVLLQDLPVEAGAADPRPGQFRDIPVYIGNREQGPEHARFIPPPPGEVLTRCMNDFERFANEMPKEIPPLVLIALLHYQFEAIHPFRDGNGRIGRVLISRSLVTSGLLEHPVVYFSGYIYKRKAEYVDRLKAVSTNNEWESWIRFILKAVHTQTFDAIWRSEQLIDLRERYRTMLKAEGAATRVLKLVDHLFEFPVVNASEAQRVLEAAKPAVYRDLSVLERLGVITEVTGRERDRDWVARQIIQVVEAQMPEPGETP